MKPLATGGKRGLDQWWKLNLPEYGIDTTQGKG